MLNKKKTTIIIIQVVLVMLFVGLAEVGDRDFRIFYASYFADLAIPFGFYFLLKLAEDKCEKMKSWVVKAVAVFSLCAISEILQYFGIFALARVFDPMDFVMYGIGVFMAALADKKLFGGFLT